MPKARALKTSEDLRKALAHWLRQIEAGKLDTTKGRTLIYGAATLGQIIAVTDIEKRLEALESSREAE